MDVIFEGLLWLAIISGAFSILALIADRVEWFCDEFDAWQKEVFTNYVDDL